MSCVLRPDIVPGVSQLAAVPETSCVVYWAPHQFAATLVGQVLLPAKQKLANSIQRTHQHGQDKAMDQEKSIGWSQINCCGW